MSDAGFCDAFSAARSDRGTWVEVEGEPILMVLDWRGVRAAAQDWRTFSSDAPFRVPIPSEENVRGVRQLPIETDPPLHTAIRAELEPWFRRPASSDYRAVLDGLVARHITAMQTGAPVDLVRDFALPLQSRALAVLLAMPDAAAERWIGWGTHVFHDGPDAGAKGADVDQFIRAELARAQRDPGDDFFSALTRFKIDGRGLTEDEMAGVANLTFAGGRDTVIHSITTLMHCLAARPDVCATLRGDARAINVAVEEIVRVTSPLTHIGRVCPLGAQVGDHHVSKDGRVSLCWAGANYDPSVFADAGVLRLDRTPNPHVGFGSGPHTCLGAPHARALLRAVLSHLVSGAAVIEVVEAAPLIERIGPFTRQLGFTHLSARVT